MTCNKTIIKYIYLKVALDFRVNVSFLSIKRSGKGRQTCSSLLVSTQLSLFFSRPAGRNLCLSNNYSECSSSIATSPRTEAARATGSRLPSMCLRVCLESFVFS